MAIRVMEKKEDGSIKWYWLVISDYGIEIKPYIYVRRDYKGILIRIYRIWANPEWGIELVKEFA
jgi:hypothetical protein